MVSGDGKASVVGGAVVLLGRNWITLMAGRGVAAAAAAATAG